MNTIDRAKYRGKCPVAGKWFYGSLIVLDGGGAAIAEKGYSEYHSELDYGVGSVGEYVDQLKLVNPETVGQFTGHQDRKGIDIYYGQDLNICFTSSSGEFIHDGIYTAVQGSLGELKFEFKGLMWVSYSYNQSPTSNTLCAEYRRLSTAYDDDRRHLIVPDEYGRDIAKDRRFPFNEERVLSFNSRYFELLEVAS